MENSEGMEKDQWRHEFPPVPFRFAWANHCHSHIAAVTQNVLFVSKSIKRDISKFLNGNEETVLAPGTTTLTTSAHSRHCEASEINNGRVDDAQIDDIPDERQKPRRAVVIVP